MTTYIVAYDIVGNSDSFDYQPLIDNLDHNGFHRVQYSFWIGELSNTPKEVHDHFKKFLDRDDRLWVSEVTNKHHYSGAFKGTNAFIAKATLVS